MSLNKNLILFAIFATFVISDIRFTNLKCVEFHPDFATFSICRLNMVQRGVVALNIHVKLLQVPVNNVSINLSLWKKVNGYRPFLYNMTVDFCKFQRNRSRSPFLKIFFDLLLKDSNINHTCPFDHDIIVKKLVLNEDMFKLLPLPNGEYMFQLKVGAYNDWKADVKAYIQCNTKFGEEQQRHNSNKQTNKQENLVDKQGKSAPSAPSQENNNVSLEY
ncbi:uncharacterized protein LOC142240072 [Haematobia irritans]|uniref:uncharacterized protein LOC142240072 n=1 Tax=Haematobia irritans TaxID=7368 RepID=UPI003F502289